MSSILTNLGATSALATLRAIGSGMDDVQMQLSTGKKVHSAQDNAAAWAISKVMEADIAGFRKVSESLSLGQATLSVARQGAESITDLLTEVKGKIVAAQEENVDRSKLQDHIGALTEQIDAIVVAAQFNGQNLLQNRQTTAGTGQVGVLASLDRTATGVSTTDITLRKRDLSTGASAITASGGTMDADDIVNTLNAPGSASFDLSAYEVEAGAAFAVTLFGSDGDGSAFDQADLRTQVGASLVRAGFATTDISYVAQDGDTIADVSRALGTKWDGFAARNGIDASVLSIDFGSSGFVASSEVTSASDTIRVAFNTLGADAGNTVGGGLEVLSQIDVSAAEGAEAALAQIEGLLEYSIAAASEFGSDGRRLETQSAFVGSLTDALRSGVGSMVDADLEEASARMQALQTQQQLAVQALSIANTAPSALLGLFR